MPKNKLRCPLWSPLYHVPSALIFPWPLFGLIDSHSSVRHKHLSPVPVCAVHPSPVQDRTLHGRHSPGLFKISHLDDSAGSLIMLKCLVPFPGRASRLYPSSAFTQDLFVQPCATYHFSVWIWADG